SPSLPAESLLRQAVELADAADEQNDASLEVLKERLARLYRRAEHLYPADRLIDFSQSQLGSAPANFWRDMSAYFINKPSGFKSIGPADEASARGHTGTHVVLNEKALRESPCALYLLSDSARGE